MTKTILFPSTPYNNEVGTFRVILIMGLFSLIQGVPAFFFTIGLPIILRDGGASLETIGLTYVVWLPLAFKWLWAPYFDLQNLPPFGSRINWLKALPILIAGTFALVALFPPEETVWPLLALSLLSAGLGATLQIIVAAWLIGKIPARQRALANSAGVSAMVLGGMLGGGLVLYLGDQYSWQTSILIVSGLILLLSLPIWGLQEGFEAPPVEKPEGNHILFAAWKSFFKKIGLKPMGCVIFCFGAAAGADVLVPAIMVDNGFSAVETGWILGTLAISSVIPASVCVGVLLRKISIFHVFGFLYCLKALMLFMLVFASSLPANAVAGFAVADFCLAGALTVATWQLYMNFSQGQQAAADFSLTTSFDALLRFLGGLAAGQIGGIFGYPTVFSIAAIAALAASFFSNYFLPPIGDSQHDE